MRLERFKIQKFSYPGPYPTRSLGHSGLVAFQTHPRLGTFGPRRILVPPWQKASCAYDYAIKELCTPPSPFYHNSYCGNFTL